MLRVDSPHQLAFIEPEADRMVGLARPRLPRRLLTGKDDREPIEVGDDAGIDGLVEREKPRLVGEQLAHGDLVFALLRELGPVGGHALFVIEPAAGVGDGERHGGQPLAGRPDEHHRVPLPRFARLFVANAAPQVDDLLAAVVGTAGAAQLPASSEVVGKRLAHGLKARTDVPLDFGKSRSPIARRLGARSGMILSFGRRRGFCECHVACGCIRCARVTEGETADNPSIEPRCSERVPCKCRKFPAGEGSFSVTSSSFEVFRLALLATGSVGSRHPRSGSRGVRCECVRTNHGRSADSWYHAITHVLSGSGATARPQRGHDVPAVDGSLANMLDIGAMVVPAALD